MYTHHCLPCKEGRLMPIKNGVSAINQAEVGLKHLCSLTDRCFDQDDLSKPLVRLHSHPFSVNIVMEAFA